jgi:AcrR family transcriptional regulator
MSQNTSLHDANLAVAARTAERALARHRDTYVDEVERLLGAGLEVMRRCGTAKSPRVADIVEHAGLSRDAFYRHFASKDDLVAAIVEAGAARLVSYAAHRMERASEPEEKLRQWLGAILSQASNVGVAEATRAVLWNGGRGPRRPSGALAFYGPLASLLEPVVTDLGSSDPARDAAVLCHAAMGRMEEFLWQSAVPTADDEAHLARFCLAAVTVEGDGGAA